MTRTRAPSVDPEKLKEFLASRNELTTLAACLSQFEDLKKNGEMTTQHIALEAIAALLSARRTHSEAVVQQVWPVEWGTASMQVPVALLAALANAWLEYRDGSASDEMAKVFGLGRRYKGQHNPISRQRTRDRDRTLSNAVELEYIASVAEGAGKSLAACIDEVADRHGSNVDSVRKAHRSYAAGLREELFAAGVLIRVKR